MGWVVQVCYENHEGKTGLQWVWKSNCSHHQRVELELHAHTNSSLPSAGSGCTVCYYSMWTVGFISPMKSAALVISCSGSTLLSILWSPGTRSWLTGDGHNNIVSCPTVGLDFLSVAKLQVDKRQHVYLSATWLPFSHLGVGIRTLPPPHNTTSFLQCVQAGRIGCHCLPTCWAAVGRGRGAL